MKGNPHLGSSGRKRLRIAHVTATFPPYYTGTGNVCYHNARVLAQRGHDMHVFTAQRPGVVDDPPGVNVHRLSPVFQIGNAPLLPQLAMLRQFDLVHLHLPFIFGAEITVLNASFRRSALVLTYHNDLIAPGLRGRFFSLYEASVSRRILRRGVTVCAVSLDHAESSRVLCRNGEPSLPLVEIPNGVDSRLFHPGAPDFDVREEFNIPPGAFVVAFVGSLDAAHHFKRVDLLLKAVANATSDEVHVLVVGGGPLQRSYEDLSQELGIRSRTHFLGAIRHQSLPQYLRTSDILALPSDSVESFGLVLIEAMACGRPVIATNLPGVRGVVSDGEDGFIIPSGDVDALGGAVKRFIALPKETRLAMGMAGRRKIEAKYDWEKIGSRLEEVYVEAMNERGNRNAH